MSTKTRNEFLLLTSIKGTNFHETRREIRDGRYTWISASGVWNYYWYISNNILLAKFRSTVGSYKYNALQLLYCIVITKVSPQLQGKRESTHALSFNATQEPRRLLFQVPTRETSHYAHVSFAPLLPLQPGNRGERQPNLLRLFPFNVSQNAVRAKQQKAQDATIYANRFT